jgi:hypothetical protein
MAAQAAVMLTTDIPPPIAQKSLVAHGGSSVDDLFLVTGTICTYTSQGVSKKSQEAAPHTVEASVSKQRAQSDAARSFYAIGCADGTEGIPSQPRQRTAHCVAATVSSIGIAGSMAILRWKDREQHQLEVVDAPWLKEYSRYSWEYL